MGMLPTYGLLQTPDRNGEQVWIVIATSQTASYWWPHSPEFTNKNDAEIYKRGLEGGDGTRSR